jgi:ABC-2 type transport system permease protein
MMRTLKLARAEVVRTVLLTIRYPIEFLVGLGIMYSIFMGLFLGASALVQDPKVLAASLDGFVISYLMWFFVISAMNRLAFHVQMEAQMGVLEQLFLNYPNILGLLLVRSVVDFFESFAVVLVLLMLIMVTTGRWLAIGWSNVGEVLLLIVVTVAGVYGFGLIFAGLALMFKRIGQVGSITQFGFFLLAYLPIEQTSGWLQITLYSLPLTLGIRLLKAVVVHHESVFGEANVVLLAALALNSAVYLLVGSVVFRLCERKSRIDGRLGQY